MANIKNVNEFATNRTHRLRLISSPIDDRVELAPVPNHKQKYVLPVSWESAVSEWVDWLAASGAPRTTQRLRRGHVRMVARLTGTASPVEVTLAILIRVCSAQQWSNEHRRGVRRSMIGFYDWGTKVRGWEHNPAADMPKVPSGTPNPKPYPDRLWNQLLMCAPPRERMMIRLAGELGMRRAEVAVCRREDLIEDLTGWSLLIHGKGDKQRLVPIPNPIAEDIIAYCPRGYLFPGPDGGHLSPAHVGKLVGDLMPEGWSMHKLRHRFASRSLERTDDLLTLRDALGHTSVATTQIYTKVADGKLRRLMEAASD